MLANLCVSYIMTSQNEEAEELMRKIEKEEEQLAYEDPDKKIYHLCIVNLVIGYEKHVYIFSCPFLHMFVGYFWPLICYTIQSVLVVSHYVQRSSKSYVIYSLNIFTKSYQASPDSCCAGNLELFICYQLLCCITVGLLLFLK